MKICSKCQVEKPLTDFYVRKDGGIRNPCKACARARGRTYENQEQVKKRIILYRVATAEKRKERRRRWYLINKEKHKKDSAEYKRNRLKSDPIFRLFHRLRGRVRHALTGQLKASNTMELLGCSTEELRQHLEKQFRPNMTWENYGYRGWHVDHIKPCAKFDLSDPSQQRACFHYSNLQPLWAKENHSKGAKYGGN